MNPKLRSIYDHIDMNFEKYVERIREYLRVKGISITGEGIAEAAEATADLLRSIGGEVKIVPLKGGHPVVYGKLRSKNPDARTLLFYSHYDVVGIPTPEEWTLPPFAAEVVGSEVVKLPRELGKVIVARGAHDKKGPNLSFILALSAIKDILGDLPINLIFVFEGEEELLSPNFKQFVNAYFEELKEADACWACGSYRQTPSGLMIIHPGYNGIIVLDLEVKGGTWGGRTDGKSLWSGYAPFIDQPLLRLTHALTTMLDRDGKILVKGFYEKWVPPTPEEKEEIRKTKERLRELTVMKDLDFVERFKGGRAPEEYVEGFLTSPQIIPIGIRSGYDELIPMKATARLYVRICPDLSSDEIIEKIKKHLVDQGFPEIEVRCTARNEWSRSRRSEDIVQALISTAKMHGVEYIIWPSSVASDAFDLFNRPPMNKPMVCGLFGHGGRFHAVDEYITVEGIRDAMKGAVTFVYEYARISERKQTFRNQ